MQVQVDCRAIINFCDLIFVFVKISSGRLWTPVRGRHVQCSAIAGSHGKEMLNVLCFGKFHAVKVHAEA
jgi:hypothetical protein